MLSIAGFLLFERRWNRRLTQWIIIGLNSNSTCQNLVKEEETYAMKMDQSRLILPLHLALHQ